MKRCKTEGCKDEVTVDREGLCARCYMAQYRGSVPKARRKPVEGRTVPVTLPTATLKKLALLGVERKESRSALVREALNTFLKGSRVKP